MNRLLFLFIFLVVCFQMQSIMYAQNFAFNNRVYSDEQTKNLERLLKALQHSESKLNVLSDLTDFKSKAQQGLDFMKPGAIITKVVCSRVFEWSSSAELELQAFFWSLYQDDFHQTGSDWRESVLAQWRKEAVRFGYMSWEIVHNKETQAVTSIAILDKNWKILFDTELVNFIVSIKPLKNSEMIVQANNPKVSVSPVNNIDSKTTSPLSFLLEGLFGRSVVLNWSVSGTAEVAPYVTSATNDAVFNFSTNQIHCWRSNATALAPLGDPMIYFGKDGQYANLYSNAIPYESRIYFTNPGDHFFTGTYDVTGSNGRIWTFTFGFSVSGGGAGLGITPQQNSSDFTLTSQNASDITFNNYAYWHITTNSYRAFFYNGGSLHLSNFNIRTGQGGPEVGTIEMRLPVQIGYTYTGILQLFQPPPPRNLNFQVEYLRGDDIHQPSFYMASSNYSIGVGEIDTLTTTIVNNSGYVDLEGGNISLNTAALGDRLTTLSAATLPIGIIGENSSKDYIFIVQGNVAGIVTPQANISDLGWESPVPPDVKINTIVSIDSNIIVGNPTSINDGNQLNLPSEFSLEQNYPNPFNPVTTIEFDLPENSQIVLKIFNLLGEEVSTLVSDRLSAGSYSYDWDASKLASGVYLYKLQAGNYIETKKMVLMR